MTYYELLTRVKEHKPLPTKIVFGGYIYDLVYDSEGVIDYVDIRHNHFLMEDTSKFTMETTIRWDTLEVQEGETDIWK